MPPKHSGIVRIPAMKFLAVRGKGDPNEEGGEYKRAMELLYGMAYTIEMSRVPIKSKGFLNMSFLRWRGFGGRRASAGLTIPARIAFSGFPCFVCQIL